MVLELIREFARPDSSLPGAVWLGFASFIGAEADEGESQLALTRLLRSDAAQLANNVVDGSWKEGLYPERDVPAIAAWFVWRMLGSPYAEGRWRAAHSLRCFARLGRWDIIDFVVLKLNIIDFVVLKLTSEASGLKPTRKTPMTTRRYLG
jgi:hypothetical protein